MSKFLKGIQGKEKKEVTAYDADAIAEKLHSMSATANTAIAPTAQVPQVEAAAKAPARKEKGTIKRKTARVPVPKDQLHRLTLDVPIDLMEQMVKDTKRSGQTIKGFIVALIYDFYEKQQ
jgi:hypothetical protein